MATGSMSRNPLSSTMIQTPTLSLGHALWKALATLGSLKITCAMFALGILILFVGTLAQDEETIVDVKRQYFNSMIAVVPFDVFLPQTIFPHEQPVPYAFAMPGGALIGLILLVNLIAAKLTRFSMRAKGGQLVAGLLFTLAGFVLVGLIVVSAHLGDGLQGEPPFSYDSIWIGCKASVFLLAAGAISWVLFWRPKTLLVQVLAWTCVAIGVFLTAAILLTNDAYRIPDPGLRIVWQLVKSLVVSVVLLIGLTLLFGMRGGNVLIHLGVGLLMLGQFIFGDAQTEERITLSEGQRTQVAFEPDTVELAVIDMSAADKNHVTAFDHPLLERSAARGTSLTTAELPFDIRVDRWMVNSAIQQRRSPARGDDEDAELQGVSKSWVLREAEKSGGAKSEGNIASAYITVRDKASQKTLGKFAVSQWLNDDMVFPQPAYDTFEVEGKKYELALRFRRNLKPYWITLNDVVLEEYTGSAIAKDYSSYVSITDVNGEPLQTGRIWMNNPMRFRGETFYQSSYTSKDRSPMKVEQTSLQVVTNAGWLIPYVACVLCGLGMLVHFGITFARFASRYDRNAIPTKIDNPYQSPAYKTFKQKSRQRPELPKQTDIPWLSYAGTLVCVLMVAIMVGVLAKVPKPKTDKIDWYAVGCIPVQHEGRMKPLASVGAQVLQALSNKPVALTLEDHSYEKSQTTGKAVSSAQWLMSVMAHEEWVRSAPLFRIDSQKLLDDLKLTRHKSGRYSLSQISDGWDNLADQLKGLDARNRNKWTFDQQKLADLVTKLRIFQSLWTSYSMLVPGIAENTTPDEIRRTLQEIAAEVAEIDSQNPPGIIPPLRKPVVEPGEKLPPARWEAFGPAIFTIVASKLSGDPVNSEPTLAFINVMEEIKKGDKNATKANEAVAKYREILQKDFGDLARSKKVNFEAWYKNFDPIAIAYWLYVMCGLATLASFVGGRVHVRRAVFWVCVMIWMLHTVAIVCRIYISERPPVINLYSASVFIGWAIVLACLVAEAIFPISVSLLGATGLGYLSLQVAYGMEIGDSMPVLQAVLDTQFWLSTHVISVSLGYSATFLAGFLGVIYVALAFVLSLYRPEQRTSRLSAMRSALPIIYRYCYGIVCFGLFFSFVGTVLGGLWGDDSWGRFWGWDPKENGAMMIVLWNALLLHARWDKMVGALGFSILAIGGNIVTAWSMFGTNQLGIGLHAYGGFESNILMNLLAFVVFQIVCIGVGLFLVVLSRNRDTVEMPSVEHGV